MKKEIIEDYLLEIGFKPNLCGFHFIVEAIQLYKVDTKITIELYPFVAILFNSTAQKVERGIRHSIERCPDDKFSKMSNREFISYSKIMIERRN